MTNCPNSDIFPSSPRSRKETSKTALCPRRDPKPERMGKKYLDGGSRVWYDSSTKDTI